jgi:NADP+-dependent farnesol dehydrogenase
MKAEMRTGLIIGASSGVGRALADLLSNRIRIFAASRRPGPAAPNVHRIVCDVRSYEEVRALFESFREPIDFVVNSAGVGFYAPIDGDYSAEWTEIVSTNVLGLVHIMSGIIQFQPRCRQFVQVGSFASRRMSRTVGNAVYSATKTAAVPLLDHLRELLRARDNLMRVCLMTPGFIKGTGFAKEFFRAEPDAATDLYANAPALAAEDVARAIVNVLDSDPNLELSEVVVRPRAQRD